MGFWVEDLVIGSRGVRVKGSETRRGSGLGLGLEVSTYRGGEVLQYAWMQEHSTQDPKL